MDDNAPLITEIFFRKSLEVKKYLLKKYFRKSLFIFQKTFFKKYKLTSQKYFLEDVPFYKTLFSYWLLLIPLSYGKKYFCNTKLNYGKIFHNPIHASLFQIFFSVNRFRKIIFGIHVWCTPIQKIKINSKTNLPHSRTCCRRRLSSTTYHHSRRHRPPTSHHSTVPHFQCTAKGVPVIMQYWWGAESKCGVQETITLIFWTKFGLYVDLVWATQVRPNFLATVKFKVHTHLPQSILSRTASLSSGTSNLKGKYHFTL